jgi:hypothetical protein
MISVKEEVLNFLIRHMEPNVADQHLNSTARVDSVMGWPAVVTVATTKSERRSKMDVNVVGVSWWNA